MTHFPYNCVTLHVYFCNISHIFLSHFPYIFDTFPRNSGGGWDMFSNEKDKYYNLLRRDMAKILPIKFDFSSFLGKDQGKWPEKKIYQTLLKGCTPTFPKDQTISVFFLCSSKYHCLSEWLDHFYYLVHDWFCVCTANQKLNYNDFRKNILWLNWAKLKLKMKL